MREKAKRIDTVKPATAAQQLFNSGESLSSNPFSGLRAAAPASLSEGPTPQPPQVGGQAPEFRVARTRKGGWPIFLERRGGGKTVTIVQNVSGNTEALLTLLKKRCAAGGKAFTDSVEVQGDHRDKIEALLREG